MENVAECIKINATEGLNLNIIKISGAESEKQYSGTIVEFNCSNNYVISDSNKASAECLQNGEWDITPPHCVKC